MKTNLQKIPGVGPSIAEDFQEIGINSVEDLREKNPEKLYKKICNKAGKKVDRCVLYICRSSVYFAESKNPDKDKLDWWKWKDEQS